MIIFVLKDFVCDFHRTGFIYDELMTKHKCEWDENYQECPERLLQPFSRCKELGLVERCVKIPVSFLRVFQP